MSFTPAINQDSPAAALRRHWLGQTRKGDAQLLKTIVADRCLRQRPLPADLMVDEEV